MPVMTTRRRMMFRCRVSRDAFRECCTYARDSRLTLLPLAQHHAPHTGPSAVKLTLTTYGRLHRPRRAGDHGDRTVRVGLLVVERRRHHAVLQRQHAGGQLRRAAAGAEVAEVALDREHRHRLLQAPNTSCSRAPPRRRRPSCARPWALTWSTSSGPMPASRQGRADGPRQAVAVAACGRRPRRSRPPRRRSWRRASGRAPAPPARSTPAPSPSTRPSRSRSNGRHAFSGASLRCDSGSNRHCRTRLSGLILLSAPPTRKKSAWSRRRMRYASPSASRLATSLSVMLLFGPLGVVQDRDVAGQHVGQILEHPQRLDGRQALLAPLLQVDRARLAVGADAGGVGQLGQLAGDQAGAELDAEARRVELALVHLAVVQGQLGGGDGQLDGAGHHLAGSCAILLLDVVLGVEVGDFAGDADGQAGGVEGGWGGRRCGLRGGIARTTAASRPMGLRTPRPVMTARRDDAAMDAPADAESQPPLRWTRHESAGVPCAASIRRP